MARWPKPPPTSTTIRARERSVCSTAPRVDSMRDFIAFPNFSVWPGSGSGGSFRGSPVRTVSPRPPNRVHQRPPMSSTNWRMDPGAPSTRTPDSGVGPNRPSAASVKTPTLAHARSARSSRSGRAFTRCRSVSSRAVSGPWSCRTSATPRRATVAIVWAVHAAIIICMTVDCGGGLPTSIVPSYRGTPSITLVWSGGVGTSRVSLNPAAS